MKKTFKKGDFVLIKKNTHDARMPVSRMGHLMEYHSHEVWVVYMTNGVELNFHEMYLEHVK